MAIFSGHGKQWMLPQKERKGDVGHFSWYVFPRVIAEKGAIIRGKAIISNIGHWKSWIEY